MSAAPGPQTALFVMCLLAAAAVCQCAVHAVFASAASPMVGVFYPGVMPNESVACFLIPSSLFVPAPTPTLLAVAEAKQGSNCGDGVNSTLVMRRSVDYGATWQPCILPVPEVGLAQEVGAASDGV